jgi:hypothetical protein
VSYNYGYFLHSLAEWHSLQSHLKKQSTYNINTLPTNLHYDDNVAWSMLHSVVERTRQGISKAKTRIKDRRKRTTLLYHH